MLRRSHKSLIVMHGMRSVRHTLKGAVVLPKLDRDRPGVITTQQWIGARHCDLFGHVNNSRFVEVCELARWECTLPANFAADCFACKVWPVVSSLSVSYFRQLSPFQLVTVQTSFFAITSGGRQFVFLQHLHDGKGNLAATVKSYVTMMNMKNRAITVPEAWSLFEEKRGQTLDASFVCGKTQLNDLEEFRQDEALQERLRKANQTMQRVQSKQMSSEFKPRYPETDLLSYESLASNGEAVALASSSFRKQRHWNSSARRSAEGNKNK